MEWWNGGRGWQVHTQAEGVRQRPKVAFARIAGSRRKIAREGEQPAIRPGGGRVWEPIFGLCGLP